MMNSKDWSKFNFQQDTIVSLKTKSDSSSIFVPKAQITNNVFVKTNLNFQPMVDSLSSNGDSLQNLPVFLKINVNDKTLIDNYKWTNELFVNRDSNCYIVKEQIHKKNTLVLIQEKKDTNSTRENNFMVKGRNYVSNDWTFIPIVLGLLLLASIVARYRKYLGLLLQSILYRFSSNKILNEKNTQVKRLTIILDSLYLIGFSLTVDQVVKGIGLFSSPPKYPFIVFVVFLSFLLVLRFFRLIVFKLSALFSDQVSFFNELFNSSLLYTRTLGLFLLPLVVLLCYSTGAINLFFIYFTLFIVFIILIMRLISMFRAFIVGGFSIFYFILYLCALEILPLLVIWKEVKSR